MSDAHIAEYERAETPYQAMLRHLWDDHRVGGLTHVRGLARLTALHDRIHAEDDKEAIDA